MSQAKAKAEAYQREAQEKYAKSVAQARERLGQQPTPGAAHTADPTTPAEGQGGPPHRQPTLLDVGREIAQRAKETVAHAKEHLAQLPATGAGSSTDGGQRPSSNRRVIGLVAAGALLALFLFCGVLGSLLGPPTTRDGASLGTSSPRLRSDEELIQGEWNVMMDDGTEKLGYVFQGDTLYDHLLGSEEPYKCNFTLDPSKNPKHITWETDHPKGHITIRGLYEFKGDLLVICANKIESARVVGEGFVLGKLASKIPNTRPEAIRPYEGDMFTIMTVLKRPGPSAAADKLRGAMAES